jgi:DNA-binding MarR family transcriptional regulator
MTIDFESEKLALKLWRLPYQTYALLKKCEDQTFEKYGLTTEQFGVLVTIGFLDKPVMVTDVARWLERSTNSISMIAERMVKAGLLRRVRNMRDRRAVQLVMTSKGENALKPATLAGLGFIREILSPLSYEDRRTFINLLEILKYAMLEYLNPETDVEETRRNEAKREALVRKWLLQYTVPSTPQAKRQGGKKKKTVRRG